MMAEVHEKTFIEWIKNKSDAAKEHNLYETKSWLLTGTSIYPNNVSLKMVCYRMAKDEKNVPVSANYLSAMLSSGNQSHPEIHAEIKLLLKGVQSDGSNPEEKLNADIFRFLPKELQCEILKKLSTECPDVISKCTILLLLIKTNPFHAREYGLSLIETLFQAEIKESPNSIKNIYRRYFVSDALPLMLQENPHGIDKKMLLSWLDKAFQYYIVTAFQSHKDGMMSPPISTGVNPMKASRPWESLAELLVLTARQVKTWNINSEDFKSEESLMQYLTSVQVRLSTEYSKTLKREFVYVGTYLLLKHVHTYNGLTRKLEATCLIQKSFSDKLATPKRHKKNAPPSAKHLIFAASNIQNGEILVSTFKSACMVWSMLHSDSSYAKSYAELLDKLDYPMWRSNLASFTKDRMVYQQEYRSYPSSADKPNEEACYRLQRACCQFALGLHHEACREILDIITDEEVQPESACCCQQTYNEIQTTEEFIFISSPTEIFNCGVTILISALRECLLRDPDNQDIIGNICVLCQLHWPKYKMLLFGQVMTRIKEMGSFKYPCFFDYFTNIEILEEFAYLKTDQGGNINLEIHASSLPKPRTITRGVKRDAQEDFKASFEKQISRSNECVQRLVVKFLIERKNEILAPLS